MLQVAQNYRTGTIGVYDVPTPALRPGGVLVRTRASLLSPGTERGKLQLARSSLLAKARERPDAVRLVLETARREGIWAAYRRVLHRLDRLTPLGYSASGTVCAVGAGVSSLRVGDRVAVGGTGYANHAEVLWVPENLTVRIPDDVEYDEAAFATIASIPLHALRLSEAGVGDVVAVIGLGLIGQLALRLAIAGGCSVIGCDLYEERIELARRTGVPGATAEQFGELVHHLTGGAGADAVIVTAASPSSRPIRLAGEVSRDRARIVAVGAVQLDVPRELFYRKELSLTVSRSYGPGRYDRQYEEKGVDYPTPYVRWTEGRNLSAVVGLLASKRLRVRDLVSHRYPIAEADEAYQLLLQDRGGPIGVILEYPADVSREPVTSNVMAAGSPRVRHVQAPSDRIGIGLIGAGSFASNVLIPTLRRVGNVRFVSVASASGLSAYDAFRKYGFVRTANTAQDLLSSSRSR